MENEKSFAMELLHDYRKQNKRLFIIIIILLFFWLITIFTFVYYIKTIDYEETTEYINTDNGGNACIGDSCNNGEINYGDSN